MNKMDVSNQIWLLYKRKLLTQAELAKRIGITTQGLSKALKKNDFKISMLKKIANALDVPITYFFEDHTQITDKDEVAKEFVEVIMFLLSALDKDLPLPIAVQLHMFFIVERYSQYFEDDELERFKSFISFKKLSEIKDFEIIKKTDKI